MRVVVTTPTGHIGARLTARLLEAGVNVTVVARDPARLPGAVARHAEVRQGSLGDRAFVTAATAGADTLFWLTPPDMTAPDLRAYQRQLGGVAAAAIAANRIRRVVNLSSIGAHHAAGVGPVNGLHDVEVAIDAVATDVTHLRPAAFMENYLSSVATIKQAGAVFLPVPGATRSALIATRDIGDVAAARILDETWRGREVLTLRSPDTLSFAEAAAVIGRAIGTPVAHVQVSAEQAVAALTGMGISSDVAGLFVEMYRAFESGHMRRDEPPSREIVTPTTFEQFVHDTLAPAINA